MNSLIELKHLNHSDVGKTIIIIASVSVGADENGDWLPERKDVEVPATILTVINPELASCYVSRIFVTKHEFATDLPTGDLILHVPIRYLRWPAQLPPKRR